MGFDYDRDASGIVTVTMDMDGQSANTMSADYHHLMGRTLDRLEAESGLTGVIIASAKRTFFAGGDLRSIHAIDVPDAAYRAWLAEDKGYLRRLERLPVPVVAAINGAALGGGLEIALACNHRVILDDPAAITGLPEVTLGLLPGAGGTMRLPRLIGAGPALELMLSGRSLPPGQALELGIVDRIVPQARDLIPAARDWIAAHPGTGLQYCDDSLPDEAAVAHARPLIARARAGVMARTRGKLPAPLRILEIVEFGLTHTADETLAFESRQFCRLLGLPETRAAIATNFFAANAVRAGKLRPPGPRGKIGRAAVAGEGAEAEALRAQLARRMVLDGPSAPELIVEAATDDPPARRALIAASFARLAPEGILASVPGEIPVAQLAGACPDPARFVGLNFAGPAPDRPLVEIIAGPGISQDTLRRAYDLVQQLRKTPILVADSPGFFIRRLSDAYRAEVRALLADGMAPQAIRQVADEAMLPAPELPETPAEGREIAEAADRLIYIQSIEALRCLNQGVLRNEAEANLGSTLGLGFPGHTGGALQFIRGIGIERFAARAAELAQHWGRRFSLPDGTYDILRDGRVKVI